GGLSMHGMVLNWNRWYQPIDGAWASRDPIGYIGGLNLYGYVENEPVGYFDPEGYMKVKYPKIGEQGYCAVLRTKYQALLKALNDALKNSNPGDSASCDPVAWAGEKL